LSLKKNIIANYASQLYVTAIGILILPLYIKYMGAEAYGLVGFFTMLQAWFGLLDLGLTPTIGRETARYRGGAMSALAYRQLFRALSLIFASIALVGGCGLWLFAEGVATRWLKVSELPMSEVILAVQIMAISVALRWMGGLYRGVISGFERLVWLSIFNASIATLRFIAVFASMWLYGFTPYVFFLHQLGVALLEVGGLFVMSRLLLPARSRLEQPIGCSISPVKPFLRFALTIAFTSSVWVLVTQIDKLILSGILPLAEYGYFTLAVLVASGIIVVSGPISNAIMPRMANLFAEGKNEEMIQVYRNATQLVSVVAGSASIVTVFCAEPLLYAWTGEAEISKNAAITLGLYSFGNGLLAVSAFPYYLQYALGDLRLHLIGNLITVITLVPSMAWAATNYGGVGAGWAWLSINLIYILAWVGYVHSKLWTGLSLTWLIKDVLCIYVPVLISIAFLFFLAPPVESRSQAFVQIVYFSLVAFCVGAASSSVGRSFLFRLLRNKL